ncbi:hypothetical protein [Streptomyces sp. NBC_01579]|uniref:hypothetical protein n=1 Tax=unclassified Streptomyces TaxID=2593676 RepID=UPI00386E13EB|nr:hypothetical protein OHB03_43995 [Streptomyces sp. NBC_01643]
MEAKREIRLNSILRAELNLPCPGDGHAFRMMAERWITAALAELAGALGEEFGYNLDFSAGALAISKEKAEPGTLWASLTVLAPVKRRQKPYEVPWTPRNWHTFLRDLESMPGESKLVLRSIGPDGHPDIPWLDVTVMRENETPELVSLSASRTTEEFDDPVTRHEAQRRWTRFFRSQVSAHDNILYGSVADDTESATGRTALETALGLLLEDTYPEMESTLRGYSWWTVCSPGVVSELGGIGRLRDTGAFHEVEPLPGGRVSLRVTENIWEYTEDRVQAGFRALAPALPRGRPTPWIAADVPRLVFQDPIEIHAHLDRESP